MTAAVLPGYCGTSGITGWAGVLREGHNPPRQVARAGPRPGPDFRLWRTPDTIEVPLTACLLR